MTMDSPAGVLIKVGTSTQYTLAKGKESKKEGHSVHPYI